VQILSIASPTDPSTRVAATLSIRFPSTPTVDFERLDQVGTDRVKEALRKPLQKLANQHFGPGKTHVEMTRVAKGSIEFGVAIVTAVAVYKAFKDYEQLRKSTVAFGKDIQNVSRSLKKVLKHVFTSKKKEIAKKAAQPSRKKKKRRK